MGDLNKTVQHYRHAISLQPSIPELHHNLALAYQSQESSRKPKHVSNERLNCNPTMRWPNTFSQRYGASHRTAHQRLMYGTLLTAMLRISTSTWSNISNTVPRKCWLGLFRTSSILRTKLLTSSIWAAGQVCLESRSNT
ncbi:MAG: tetratricopeptide repeat protein [Thiobacillus sp.]|nr:MAG: tetratricopeptide repeat protein [Thiobacillus sp.]